MLRVGDVYPNNMIEVHVRAYLYRWRDGWNMSDDDMAYEVCPIKSQSSSQASPCLDSKR